jgi:hypothetical protein
MFRRMFGGDAKGGQAVSQSSANKTVDAIQKLGEVLTEPSSLQRVLLSELATGRSWLWSR